MSSFMRSIFVADLRRSEGQSEGGIGWPGSFALEQQRHALACRLARYTQHYGIFRDASEIL